MAVPDQEPSGPRDQTSWDLLWKEALDHLPAITIAGGLLIYSISISFYEIFYGRLGVDPNDVGLTYAGTLARSSGLIAAYIIVAIVIFALRHFYLQDPSIWRIRLYMLSVMLLIIIALGCPSLRAEQAANAVKAGKPLRPIAMPGRNQYPLLTIHADPVTVEPSGKPDESPATDRLKCASLLYLGQAGGTVVLYNPAIQQAVYVPASAVILHVTKYRAEPPPDAACK
jgi:hypothetical protein